MPHRLRSVALSLALPLGAFALELGPRATAAGAVPVADRLFSIGVGGGPTYLSGDASDVFHNGYNALGFLRLNLPAFPIDPRVSLTYQKLDMQDSAFTDGLAFDGGGNLETASLVLEGQIAILPLGPVQTYGIVGAGWSNFKLRFEDVTTGNEADYEYTEVTYTAGLGVSIGLGSLRGFAEGRLHRIEYDGTMLALDPVDLFPVTFGILF